MKVYTQPGGGSKHVLQARKVQALMSRYRASGDLGHVGNFARGVLIGGIIVLFVWLNVG
jgi:hypothetical protein